MASSRRGYDDATPGPDDNLLLLDPNFPTRLANPFRTSGGGVLVPPLVIAPTALVKRGVHATPLRAGGIDPQVDAADTPLLQTVGTGIVTTPDSPYFRYEQIQRMANLLTSHSNVYSIWVTVGYFEVEKIQRTQRPDLTDEEFAGIYGDGYMLGQELGLDTGQVERHRAFYIFDRSIPVGYKPGEKMNIDKAVLLRRMIE
jgi:hypothetical protein